MSNFPIESTQKGKPAWLDLFLSRTFFGPCPHHKLSKNDLNNYCINCDLPLCKNCITSGSHAEHKLLKIYRHVYKSAVPLTDIEKHIDCSRIQPYKCNKKLVVSLKPLPHNGSGSQANNREAACEICKRFLHDPTLYRYCCISCKVEAFATKMTSSEPPFLAIATTLVPNENEEGCPATERGEKARACKRKWTPNKAPLF